MTHKMLSVTDNSIDVDHISMPPLVTPLEWTGSLGEPVQLTCKLGRNHVSVVWTRSGDFPLAPSANQHVGVLTISKPVESDSGYYICTATSNQGNKNSSNAFLKIDQKRSEKRIRVEPKWQKVSEGMSAEVRCIIDNKVGRAVKWIKYGESSLKSNAHQVGNTLKIIDLEFSDRGNYVCKAIDADRNYEDTAQIEVERKFFKIVW